MNLKLIFVNAVISIVIFLVGFVLINQFIQKQISEAIKGQGLVAQNNQAGQNQPTPSAINGQVAQDYGRTVETSNFSGTIKSITDGQIALQVDNQEDIRKISVQANTEIYKLEFPDNSGSEKEVKKIKTDLSSLKVGQKIFVAFNSDFSNTQVITPLIIGIYPGDKE